MTRGEILAWTDAAGRTRPNLVVTTRTPGGERRVVKVHATYAEDYPGERDALRQYATRVTPGVRAARLLDRDDRLRLLELEWVDGRHIDEGWPDAVPDAELTAQLARAMRALWAVPEPMPSWRSLPSYMVALHQPARTIEPALLARAAALGAELQQGVEPVLLHGDLHHENVLVRPDGELVVIDPKGVVGAPGFDVGALMWNPIGEVLDQPRPDLLLAGRVEVLAAELPMDAAEVRAWAWVVSVLSAAWDAEDGSTPDYALGIAALLDPVSR